MQLGIASWEGRLAPVFDTAEQLVLITTDEDRELRRQSVALTGQWPLQRAQAVLGHGVQVLLCGAISRPAVTLLRSAGVTVLSWLGGPCDQVLQAYLEGNLADSEFNLPCGCQSPGCRRARMRRGQGQGRDKGQKQGRGGNRGRGPR